MKNEEVLNIIIRHIKRVEDNCNTVGRKLMSTNPTFALKMIQLGRLHDASKFDSFEFLYLGNYFDSFEFLYFGNYEEVKPPEFFQALQIHHSKNPHHPEYWEGGITTMPEEYLAEMVCDCLARGQEFGTDTKQWFTKVATQKYGFQIDDWVGKTIMKYLDLLLAKPF